MALNITMKLDRETKGAVRYQEVDGDGNLLRNDADGAAIGILYIRKARLGKTVPKSLTVAIEI